MVAFFDLLSDSWERTRPARGLVVVPFVWSLLQVGQIFRAVGSDRVLDVAFPFPKAVVGLWSFVNPPAPDGFSVAGPLWVLPFALVAEGVLAAGYLGSLEQTFRTGRYDFVANARRYVVDLLVYAVLVALVGFLVVAAALASGILGLLVGVPLFLLAGYLFYAAPFLVVTEDRSIGSALRRSYRLAVAGGEHLAFFVKYLVVGAVVSVPVSLLAYTAGVGGILLASAVAAPVGFAFSATTLAFLRGDRARGRRVDTGFDGRTAGGGERPD
ncbi:hypothetical protein [Halomarina litorea]|uniref:hypothetical protein n=1 Tax=Halomarina litorea TaxID=2961595 RepID=UPI0020C36E53|nr:hypothetical protein [Halomarina sp. BCD28]